MTARLHLPRRSAPGFTLVELLTVIAIIAILMSLLLSAITGARESARRAQAANDCQGIVAAVKSYNSEYGRYPSIEEPSSTSSTSNTKDVKVGDSAAGITGPGAYNRVLFYTLRAMNISPNTDHALNPKQISFMEGKNSSGTSNPKGGFAVASSSGSSTFAGCFFDPWGEQYCVVMDTNYDNELDVVDQYTDFKDPAPRAGVGAFSLGKDGQLGKATGGSGNHKYRDGSVKSDDIVTWQ